MYNDQIEKLIEMALMDGELTEKEKQVLFKKAEAMGIDLDEFEMVLDARLFEKSSRCKRVHRHRLLLLQPPQHQSQINTVMLGNVHLVVQWSSLLKLSVGTAAMSLPMSMHQKTSLIFSKNLMRLSPNERKIYSVQEENLTLVVLLFLNGRFSGLIY